MTARLSNSQQACRSNRASLASISETGLAPLHGGTKRLFGSTPSSSKKRKIRDNSNNRGLVPNVRLIYGLYPEGSGARQLVIHVDMLD